MSKNLYSIYDTQIKKFVELSNKTNLKATIKSLRNFISRDNDITNLSDKEVFNDWGFILIRHHQYIAFNNKIDFSFIEKNMKIDIIYNSNFLRR